MCYGGRYYLYVYILKHLFRLYLYTYTIYINIHLHLFEGFSEYQTNFTIKNESQLILAIRKLNIYTIDRMLKNRPLLLTNFRL